MQATPERVVHPLFTVIFRAATRQYYRLALKYPVVSASMSIELTRADKSEPGHATLIIRQPMCP